MKSIYSGFVIFEIIISLIITNLILLAGSFFTAGLLFPVLLVSTMNYVKRFYSYKEYQGIIYTFITYIKGNIIRTFKALFLISFLYGLLIINVTVFNQIIVDVLPATTQFIVYVAQIFMLYQLTGMLLHSAIILTEDKTIGFKDLYKQAFIRFNYYPIRAFFSVLSFIVVGVTTLYFVDYTYLLFLPVAMLAFYVVNSPNLEQKNEEDLS